MSIGISFIFVFVPFLILLYLAGEVYFRNPVHVLNRSAGLLFVICSAMFLGEWLIATLPVPHVNTIGYFLKYGGAFSTMSVAVYFFIRLSGVRLRPYWTAVAVFFPLAAFATSLFFPSIFSVAYVENGYFKEMHLSRGLRLLTYIFTIYTLSSIIFLALFGRQRLRQYMKLVRAELRKYTPILAALLLAILWIFIFMFIPKHLLDTIQLLPTRVFSLYSTLIWAIGVRYAMVRFNFLPAPERKYQILFRLSKHGIVLLDRHARVFEANPSFESMLGLPEAQLKGKYFDLFLISAEQEPFRQQYYKSFRELQPIRRELSLIDIRGQELIVEAESEFIVLEEEMLQYVVLRNITERKRNELQMRHMAYHDDLTDLANRHLFQERIEHALREVGKAAPMAAVLLLDLDRFKLINDTLGHAAGDALLLNIAEKLRACCDTQATIARLGGDEFAILLPAIFGEEAALQTADCLMAALQAPIPLEGQEYYVTVSIGISISPEDGITPNELLRNADTAMYASKQSGRNMYSRFSCELNETNERSLSIVNGLRHALERGEFLVYYQPQVSMVAGNAIGGEALIRWQHPVNGIMLPGDFIHIAEETGLIVPMGLWVLETAMRDWMRRRELGNNGLLLSVNLSPKQALSGQFVELLAELLEATGFPPSLLCLEVTESIAIHDTGLALEVCRGIRELGVRLAIDDFGTGYSSLSALQRFPFTSMKLDRSFINAIGRQEKNAAILKAMLDLARNLRMDVVCEGVETSDQWDQLRELGCDAVQGYLVSRPVPLEEFERFVLGADEATG